MSRFELDKANTPIQNLKLHEEQFSIAASDASDALMRMKYHLYMIYRHSLYKALLDRQTMLPAYKTFKDYIENREDVKYSTAWKYIKQMRILEVAGFSDRLEEVDNEVLEYISSKAQVSPRTGQIIDIQGAPEGSDLAALVARALTEVGFEFGAQNVPPKFKKDALHQVINPMTPRIWVERVQEDAFEFEWVRKVYDQGGDNPATIKRGRFTIVFNDSPPGDVAATIIKMLGCFS